MKALAACPDIVGVLVRLPLVIDSMLPGMKRKCCGTTICFRCFIEYSVLYKTESLIAI